MSEPEFLICLECETPTYAFELREDGKLISALCSMCGNDDNSLFTTEAEFNQEE